jgi:hypothetical protein
MKKLVVTLFLTLASFTIQAQEGLTWHTDLNKATEIARQ